MENSKLRTFKADFTQIYSTVVKNSLELIFIQI
jgi:hypothetical protein